MATIIAMGGGVFMGKDESQFPSEVRPVHEEIIRRIGKRHPRVLYIPTAANDSEKKIAGFNRYYSGLGCSVDTLRLLRKRPDQAEIRSKINAADAVFVTGGNTHRTIATWKRCGVDALLRQAYKQGTIMSGYSAGAICWFQYGNSDSFSKEKIFRVTGMGIIKALMCPHYDSEPHRQPALKKMMKRTPGMVAIALDEYAAIEIIDGKYRILTSKPDAKARRVYWRRGEYMVEAIKTDGRFQSLGSLLSKESTSIANN